MTYASRRFRVFQKTWKGKRIFQVSNFPFVSVLSTNVAISVCSRFRFRALFAILHLYFIFAKVNWSLAPHWMCHYRPPNTRYPKLNLSIVLPVHSRPFKEVPKIGRFPSVAKCVDLLRIRSDFRVPRFMWKSRPAGRKPQASFYPPYVTYTISIHGIVTYERKRTGNQFIKIIAIAFPIITALFLNLEHLYCH